MTKLNPFILIVVDNQLNPDKYTREQLEDNWDDATYIANYAAATNYAPYTDATNYAAAAACTTYRDAYRAAYWLGKYFTVTGENKQDYINELENKND